MRLDVLHERVENEMMEEDAGLGVEEGRWLPARLALCNVSVAGRQAGAALQHGGAVMCS